MFATFLHAIGWRTLDATDLLVFGCVAGALFVIMAWIADVVMQRLSLGLLGNVIVLATGAVVGLFVLVLAGFPPTRSEVLPALFACGLGAVLALLGAASLKRIV